MPTPLRYVVVTYGHTDAFKRGLVPIEGLDLQEVKVSPYKAHVLMCRTDELDVAEISVGTYFSAISAGLPITAIPVFPYRRYQHSSILYNVKSGITNPKDLEGRVVGVRRYYTLTAAFWARGVLQDEYGVDLNKITWMVFGDEIVQDYQPPANVIRSAPGKDLRTMLLAGELDAAISVTATGNRGVDSPDIRLMIPDYKDAERDYYLKTGIYPIDHLITLKKSLVAAHPEVVGQLYRPLVAAKDRYVQELGDGPAKTLEDEGMLWLRSFMGDPMPCGVANNRRTLEAAVRWGVDQKMLPAGVTVEDLFADPGPGLAW